MLWDYIIVGGGSAGCALVHELANGRGQKTILVLEAGGSDRSPFIRIPAGTLRACVTNDWGYRSQPDPSRNGHTERWVSGRVLGGNSSINSTVFVRGAAADFDRWAEQRGRANAPGWSADEVIPIFREFESADQSGVLRGKTGPLHVRTVRRPHTITDAFLKSAGAVGYPFNEDYNGASQEGVAYAQLSQRHGLRCSSADAFLKPILGKGSNVTLLLNSWVQKIELIKGRAVAVCFTKDGKLCREMGHEIIVCAGAINSPKLLMLSGIGDAQELRRHHIEVAIDLPGVGRNLKDHPLVKLVYKTRIQTYNLTGGLFQRLRILTNFLINREGPISNLFEGVGFLKTRPSEPFPDVQLHFTPLGYLVDAATGRVTLAPYPSVTVLVNKSHPISTGCIRLASRDPKIPPLIESRLLEEEADVDTLVRGIVMVRKIMEAMPIANLLQEESVPGSHFTNEATLRDYVRDHSQMQLAHHFAGTCRMGSGADAVVGPDLRVRGVDNLWVADASIMPELISGNTNAACMMIGKKLGKQFIGRRDPQIDARQEEPGDPGELHDSTSHRVQFTGLPTIEISVNG